MLTLTSVSHLYEPYGQPICNMSKLLYSLNKKKCIHLNMRSQQQTSSKTQVKTELGTTSSICHFFSPLSERHKHKKDNTRWQTQLIRHRLNESQWEPQRQQETKMKIKAKKKKKKVDPGKRSRGLSVLRNQEKKKMETELVGGQNQL